MVSTRNDNISSGCDTKREFLYGWGSSFVRQWDGGDGGSKGKVPSMGDMDTYMTIIVCLVRLFK